MKLTIVIVKWVCVQTFSMKPDLYVNQNNLRASTTFNNVEERGECLGGRGVESNTWWGPSLTMVTLAPLRGRHAQYSGANAG